MDMPIVRNNQVWKRDGQIILKEYSKTKTYSGKLISIVSIKFSITSILSYLFLQIVCTLFYCFPISGHGQPFIDCNLEFVLVVLKQHIYN